MNLLNPENDALCRRSNDSKKGKKSSATSKAAKKKITKKTVKPKKKASDNSANVNRPTSADTPAVIMLLDWSIEPLTIQRMSEV